MTLAPCLSCGEPGTGSRCRECQNDTERTYDRKPKTAASSRGYDRRWRNLSERARQVQPYCTDCGTEDDLQADHSPEAWRRYDAGLPIRLQDVDVVCGRCNIERGTARPGGERSSRHAATLAGQAKFQSENDSQLGGGREVRR